MIFLDTESHQFAYLKKIHNNINVYIPLTPLLEIYKRHVFSKCNISLLYKHITSAYFINI